MNDLRLFPDEHRPIIMPMIQMILPVFNLRMRAGACCGSVLVLVIVLVSSMRALLGWRAGVLVGADGGWAGGRAAGGRAAGREGGRD